MQTMDRSFEQIDRKLKASAEKRTQVEMPFVALVPDAQVLPMGLIKRTSFNGCLVEAARHSGCEDQDIADRIFISHGYMSRFMRGVGQQWAKRIVAFMRVTQSIAPLQWIAEQVGCDVVVRSAICAELAAAKARVAELERSDRMAA